MGAADGLVIIIGLLLPTSWSPSWVGPVRWPARIGNCLQPPTTLQLQESKHQQLAVVTYAISSQQVILKDRHDPESVKSNHYGYGAAVTGAPCYSILGLRVYATSTLTHPPLRRLESPTPPSSLGLFPLASSTTPWSDCLLCALSDDRYILPSLARVCIRPGAASTALHICIHPTAHRALTPSSCHH